MKYYAEVFNWEYMNRFFTISYTSDIHGFFSDTDYSTGKPHAAGLCRCSTLFERDKNSLIIDGGDTLQGSPFTYWYHKQKMDSQYLPAQILNAAGYHFITLGNHDFNYGKAVIEQFVDQLDAVCLCANVDGIRGVKKTAVVTLENGLRIGLTGVTSHYISKWEPPENIQGLTIRDAFSAAEESLVELKKADVDVKICIYHGGFENDPVTGEKLELSDENQGWRICRELDYDILLSGHQHQLIDEACITGTHTCQPPDKACGFIRLTTECCTEPDGKETVSTHSCFVPAGEKADKKLVNILREKEEKASQWLDLPIGYADTLLKAEKPINMASGGSLIANFFNQVQLEASGAQISVTSLSNNIAGFTKKIKCRDILVNYPFPNTLKTVLVNRKVLKQALERCAEYFTVLSDGSLTVSETFLKPVEQHFNYDYFSGIEVQMDVRRPLGQRVTSIRYKGEELEDETELTLCMNSYRASGAGGYPFYTGCRVVKELNKDISELIMDYVTQHDEIKIDQTKWLKVIGCLSGKPDEYSC